MCWIATDTKREDVYSYRVCNPSEILIKYSSNYLITIVMGVLRTICGGHMLFIDQNGLILTIQWSSIYRGLEWETLSKSGGGYRQGRCPKKVTFELISAGGEGGTRYLRPRDQPVGREGEDRAWCLRRATERLGGMEKKWGEGWPEVKLEI